MNELKLCPFCGGKAEVLDDMTAWSKAVYYVACCECGASTDFYGTEKRAIEAWKRRKEYNDAEA